MLFKLENNANYCFDVWHYNKEKAMGITIIDANTGENIETLTVLDSDNDYEIGVITVYNDSIVGDEVEGYKTGTEILKDLGIVKKIWKKYKLGLDGVNYIPIAICSINLSALAKYAKNWDYWEYKPKIKKE